MLATVHQRTVSLGNIGGYRPKVAHIEPNTQRKRPIIRRCLTAAVGGKSPRQPPDKRPLCKVHIVLLIVAAAVFPGGQRVLESPFTLEQRHR